MGIGLFVDVQQSELRRHALHGQEHGAVPPTLIGDELTGVVLIATARPLVAAEVCLGKVEAGVTLKGRRTSNSMFRATLI